MKLPDAFITRTRALLGDEWDAFEQALQAPSPVSVRLNPKKLAPLPAATAGEVPWASQAFYLAERPSFTLDPLFHAGCYYVQEASSMYLEQLVRRHVSEAVEALDLCAAPGGKTTHLLSLLPNGSRLTANEVIRSRSYILLENVIKWGYPRVTVTQNDPKDFGVMGARYDLLLTDVPCSGEGMFRKDAKAVGEWSVANVQLCAERQRRIMADVWLALRTGGLLFYSTCTYNREENEANIEWICSELGADIVEAPRRFWPHRERGEGFCVSALRKTAEDGVKGKKVKGERDLRVVAMEDTHAEIMSVDFDPAAWPSWDVDKATALRYLRREAFSAVPARLPKGLALITYQHHPLGLIKNIGNRANNLYPKEWRIRQL